MGGPNGAECARLHLFLTLEAIGAVGAQGAQRRPAEAVEHDRVGLGRRHDGVLPVVVHRRLGGRHHPGPHLHTGRAERERGRHRPSVADASGCDDREVNPRCDQRDEHHRAHLTRVLEAAAFAALDHESIDSGINGLQGGRQRRHHVEDGDPGVLQGAGVLGRVTGRCRHERDALVGHEVHDRRIAHEQLGDVDAERLVGQVAHLHDLGTHLVEQTRRRLDHPESAGVGHGGCESGASDPSHRCLNDWIVDAEQV